MKRTDWKEHPMSEVGDAFIASIGKPDMPTPSGLNFKDPTDKRLWEQIHREIGSGWFMNRFLYLFGESLDELLPCLDAWPFLIKPGRERMILGRNAYGALLVAEEPTNKGYTCPVYMLDPLN